MLLVALTGGIGSGKSSVSARLAERGAAIVDADEVVKQLQRPGQAVFVAMVERWGDGIVRESGELDRQAVADLVFADEAELKALNKIVHPAVRREMARQAEALADTDRFVVLDIPLLAEGDAGKRGAEAVIVVDCPVETAIERLVAHRGFSRADAEARMAAQVTREERLALADFVIDNSGDLDHLHTEVERCWSWLEALAARAA
ncbi:MAG: dephospho-CoA kinase [Acidimicrobiales bacterium]